MFVPVVTKDMQLFPQYANSAQRQRQQAGLKNVRSRAHSLEANIHVSNNTSRSTTTVSSTQTSNAHKSNGRNCRSVGALPTSSSAALQTRSPPNTNESIRKPLESIAEGVALSSVKDKTVYEKTASKLRARENNPSIKSGNQKSSKTSKNNNKSAPDLNATKIAERQIQMNLNGFSTATTSSSPGLHITSLSNAKSKLSLSTGTSSGRSLVKWLSNTLKGKNSSRDHDATICAKCARLDDNEILHEAKLCECVFERLPDDK